MLDCGINGVATLDCIFPLITNLIYWLILFSGSVALIIIIVSGIKFITSGGDTKSVEGAKKSMTFAILGLLLVFFAFLILNTIASVTGVACIKDFSTGVSLASPFQACGISVSGGSGGAAGGFQPKCSSSNTSGSCPSGQTCGYDSNRAIAMWTCLYNCDFGHPSGYCSHGICKYNAVNGIYICQ